MMGNLCKHLQAGQSVVIKELETGIRAITIVSAGQSGSTVSEVGGDYVIIDDAAEGMQTRIPVHFIQLTTSEAVASGQAA